jgi:hypothetical protein
MAKTPAGYSHEWFAPPKPPRRDVVRFPLFDGPIGELGKLVPGATEHAVVLAAVVDKQSGAWFFRRRICKEMGVLERGVERPLSP